MIEVIRVRLRPDNKARSKSVHRSKIQDVKQMKSGSFSRSLGYTDNPVCLTKPTVLLKCSVVPCSCWCSDKTSGRIWVLRLVKVGQSWSIWSAVWFSVWQVQSGDCTSFIVLYMCKFNLLCPVRRRRIMT